MKWKQIKIHTTTQAVDLISDMLAGLGVCGIEIEDNVPISEEETKGMFIDILPDLPPDDGTAKVSFYLSADEETKEASFQSGDTVRSQDEPDMPFEELMEAVKNGLADLSSYMDIGSGEIEISETADADWMNAYKEFFKPFVLGNVLIKPVWEEDVPHDGPVVVLDPGTAFGTGTHETTRLCLAGMQKYIEPGMTVFDAGCGSGILAIAAAVLGAENVTACDIDPEAVRATEENAALNEACEGRISVFGGNILEDDTLRNQIGYEKYDLVVSNILAPVIIALAGIMYRHLKPGAVWISSGIVAEKEADVLAAIKARPEYEVLGVEHDGDWVSITARRVK